MFYVSRNEKVIVNNFNQENWPLFFVFLCIGLWMTYNDSVQQTASLKHAGYLAYEIQGHGFYILHKIAFIQTKQSKR